jgi:hypothetical protein
MTNAFGLVAEEFLRTATEADTGNAEDSGEQEQKRVPVNHGAGKSGRIGEILSGPTGDQRADDDALEADDEKELAATAAPVKCFDFVRCQVAFFGWDQGVSHESVVSCERDSLEY